MTYRTASIVLLPILVLILSCGGTKEPDSAEGFLGQARKRVTDAQYPEAIKSLRRLIEKHPGDPLAPEAQYMLGDTYMVYTKDFDQAIMEYRKVVSDFPDSRFAINAQFMLGYIYANFIYDLGMARQEYTRFLELYSDKADSGLVQSVRFELENLGKDLNEIPRLRHITS